MIKLTLNIETYEKRIFLTVCMQPDLLLRTFQIKKVRNACMHSNDLEMSDADMTTSLNLMVAFLEEPELKKYQSACDAALKIKQVTISLYNFVIHTVVPQISLGLGKCVIWFLIITSSWYVRLKINTRTLFKYYYTIHKYPDNTQSNTQQCCIQHSYRVMYIN